VPQARPHAGSSVSVVSRPRPSGARKRTYAGSFPPPSSRDRSRLRRSPLSICAAGTVERRRSRPKIEVPVATQRLMQSVPPERRCEPILSPCGDQPHCRRLARQLRNVAEGAVKAISGSRWSDGFRPDSGPSPGDPCSVRAGQGLAGAHFRRSRIKALARMRSFLKIATIATLAGFPALTMASYLGLEFRVQSDGVEGVL
jgi:hypothetical protein